MPWHVEDDNPDCSGYAVVQDSNGKLMGCHDTRDEANGQMAALYASEEKALSSLIDRLEMWHKYKDVNAPLPGSAEERQGAVSDAVRSWGSSSYPEVPGGDYTYTYVAATYPDHVIACVDHNGYEIYFEIPYTVDADNVVSLGTPQQVEISVAVKALSDALDDVDFALKYGEKIGNGNNQYTQGNSTQDAIREEISQTNEQLAPYLNSAANENGTIVQADTYDAQKFVETAHEAMNVGWAVREQLEGILRDDKPLEEMNANALRIVAEETLPAFDRLGVEGAADMAAEIKTYLDDSANPDAFGLQAGVDEGARGTTLDYYPAVMSAVDVAGSIQDMGWAVEEQLTNVLNGEPLEDMNSNALRVIVDSEVLPAMANIGVEGADDVQYEINSYLDPEGYPLKHASNLLDELAWELKYGYKIGNGNNQYTQGNASGAEDKPSSSSSVKETIPAAGTRYTDETAKATVNAVADHLIADGLKPYVDRGFSDAQRGGLNAYASNVTPWEVTDGDRGPNDNKLFPSGPQPGQAAVGVELEGAPPPRGNDLYHPPPRYDDDPSETPELNTQRADAYAGKISDSLSKAGLDVVSVSRTSWDSGFGTLNVGYEVIYNKT